MILAAEEEKEEIRSNLADNATMKNNKQRSVYTKHTHRYHKMTMALNQLCEIITSSFTP